MQALQWDKFQPRMGSQGVDSTLLRLCLCARLERGWALSGTAGAKREEVHLFFYKHSVFQSEARICSSFSQIQPPNMLT